MELPATAAAPAPFYLVGGNLSRHVVAERATGSTVFVSSGLIGANRSFTRTLVGLEQLRTRDISNVAATELSEYATLTGQVWAVGAYRTIGGDQPVDVCAIRFDPRSATVGVQALDVLAEPGMLASIRLTPVVDEAARYSTDLADGVAVAVGTLATMVSAVSLLSRRRELAVLASCGGSRSALVIFSMTRNCLYLALGTTAVAVGWEAIVLIVSLDLQIFLAGVRSIADAASSVVLLNSAVALLLSREPSAGTTRGG